MNVKIAIVPIAPVEGQTRSERERLAVHAALNSLLDGEDFHYAHRPSGAPYLEGRPELSISVSHSLTLAAVALANGPVGIDIEQPRPQLQRIARRFLSDHEQANFGESVEKLLRAWTAKEAIFKAAGKEGIDFARDIRLAEDMSTATFKDDTTYCLNITSDLPDNNLMTVGTLENPEQIIIITLI